MKKMSSVVTLIFCLWLVSGYGNPERTQVIQKVPQLRAQNDHAKDFNQLFQHGTTLHLGAMDPGEDHDAVRISGDNCDLVAIYSMDFPLGRGPIGRNGIIQSIAESELHKFFPDSKTDGSLKPWIRLNGEFIFIERGVILIRSANDGVAMGELELEGQAGILGRVEFELPYILEGVRNGQ